MATTLSALKKQSKSLISQIKQTQESSSSGGYKGDERIWTPMFDKEKGVGYAKIRFLPAPQGEDLPYITRYTHGFKGPTGKWYIENSLSTIKQKDPVGEMNSRLWNSGIESDKDIARKFKRRTELYANVLIVDDPMRPELNGTVKLYKYGNMIHKILETAMFPQFETDEPLNPFCPWEGSTFEIRIVGKQLNGNVVPNYEKSFFHQPESLGSDEYIEEVWSQCHSLQSMVSEDQFKTYDELKQKLFEVLGATVGSGVETVPGFGDIPAKQSNSFSESPATKEQEPKLDTSKVEDDIPLTSTTSSSVDDDDMSFFENL